MTLIVGIKCKDGVVLGADSAATLGNTLGLSTVIESTSKLRVIERKMIVGVSGPTGLGQLYVDRVEKLCKSGLLRRDGVNKLEDAMSIIRDGLFEDAQVAYKLAAMGAHVVGANIAQVSVLHSTLMALPIAGKAELIQFDYQCQPDAATPELPYISIGSGQALADPFLAFLRRIFWPGTFPPISPGYPRFELGNHAMAVVETEEGRVFTICKNNWLFGCLEHGETECRCLDGEFYSAEEVIHFVAT